MRSTRTRARRARGFTLIEIMVVLVILGMMAAVISVNIYKNHEHAQKDAARLDLQAISNAVDLYRVRHAVLPDTLDQLVPDELRRLHPDPWGNAYVYSHTGNKFDVISYGPDRAAGGDDDITADPPEKS